MKKRTDIFASDVLYLFGNTNDKYLKFYATEIENDPANATFIAKYKKTSCQY